MARYFNPDSYVKEKNLSSTFATSLSPFVLSPPGDHSGTSFKISSRMLYTGYIWTLLTIYLLDICWHRQLVKHIIKECPVQNDLQFLKF